MKNTKQQKARLMAEAKSISKRLAAIGREVQGIEQVQTGDVPSPEIARLIKSQSFSYEVHFERRKALKKVRCKGPVNISLRRFSSTKEANQHGKRFTKIHKHRGYVVVRVSKRANAWINWSTGKTNPVL